MSGSNFQFVPHVTSAAILALVLSIVSFAAPQDSTCSTIPLDEATFNRRVAMQDNRLRILANDCATAEQLANWVNDELKVLATKIDLPVSHHGIIVAIESRNDPWKGTSTYDPRHDASTGTLHWTPRPSVRGRKYVRSYAGPYFRLNFALGGQDLKKLTAQDERTDFVVFLTTDSYYQTVAAELESIVQKTSQHVYDEYGLIKAALAIGSLQHQYLDLQLMHLARREVLWLAVIDSLPMEEESREQLIETIRTEIDKQWKELFDRRLSD